MQKVYVLISDWHNDSPEILVVRKNMEDVRKDFEDVLRKRKGEDICDSNYRNFHDCVNDLSYCDDNENHLFVQVWDVT